MQRQLENRKKTVLYVYVNVFLCCQYYRFNKIYIKIIDKIDVIRYSKIILQS